MTVIELIERLEEYRDELGDVEVRLMTQENWPFENRILGLASGADINDAELDEEDDDDGDVPDGDVVYIVEGSQICYGTKRAWDVAR